MVALLVFVLLTSCGNEKPDAANEVQQEPFEVRGERVQLTDTTQQLAILEQLMAAEQQTISDSEARSVLTSQQGQYARTIEFRIEGMWYSFNETGILTVHRVGNLPEYFHVSETDLVETIFRKYAE